MAMLTAQMRKAAMVSAGKNTRDLQLWLLWDQERKRHGRVRDMLQVRKTAKYWGDDELLELIDRRVREFGYRVQDVGRNGVHLSFLPLWDDDEDHTRVERRRSAGLPV